MLVNQNRITLNCIIAWGLISLGMLLLAGCAQHGQRHSPHDHNRARFDTPPEVSPSNVPYGKTDWDAVVTALGGAGKKAGNITRQAGGYSKAMWAHTGGKVVDV